MLQVCHAVLQVCHAVLQVCHFSFSAYPQFRRQSCQRRTLYVSFRDLGWQVRGFMVDWRTFWRQVCLKPTTASNFSNPQPSHPQLGLSLFHTVCVCVCACKCAWHAQFCLCVQEKKKILCEKLMHQNRLILIRVSKWQSDALKMLFFWSKAWT